MAAASAAGVAGGGGGGSHPCIDALGLFDAYDAACGGGGGGGGAAGSGGSGSSIAAAITAAVKSAKIELNKQKCYKLLGYASAAAAADRAGSLVFNDVAGGELIVSHGRPVGALGHAPADTLGIGYGGVINVNTSYNWANFASVTTSSGGTFNYLAYLNGVYGTNMNSSQLATLIIIHEIAHNSPTEVPETIKGGQDIYNDCIK